MKFKQNIISISTVFIIFVIGIFYNIKSGIASPITAECGDGTVNLPGCGNHYETNINPIKDTILTTIISRLVIYVGIAAIITLMISGLYYLISLGNEEKTKKAAKMIYYSIFGLVIAVFSYVIIQIVVNLQFQ